MGSQEIEGSVTRDTLLFSPSWALASSSAKWGKHSLACGPPSYTVMKIRCSPSMCEGSMCICWLVSCHFNTLLNLGGGPSHKMHTRSQLQVCLFSLAFAPVTQGHQSSCFMTLMLSALKSHPCCWSVKKSGHKHFFVLKLRAQGCLGEFPPEMLGASVSALWPLAAQRGVCWFLMPCVSQMQTNGLGIKALGSEMGSSRGEARALGWGLKIPYLRFTLASFPQAGRSQPVHTSLWAQRGEGMGD